jgi:hypothetical protein
MSRNKQKWWMRKVDNIVGMKNAIDMIQRISLFNDWESCLLSDFVLDWVWWYIWLTLSSLAGTEDGKQNVMLEIRQLVPLFLMDCQIRWAVILAIQTGRLVVERQSQVWALYSGWGRCRCLCCEWSREDCVWVSRQTQIRIDIECSSYWWHIELGFRLVSWAWCRDWSCCHGKLLH